MTKLAWGMGGILLFSSILAFSATGAFGDPAEICQPRNESYNVMDTQQCDKYHECGKNSKGKFAERLCDDGFVFSVEIKACDYPHNVNCTARPELQPTKSTNPDCPRSNGFYPFPPTDSCQKFYHCLEGKAYEKTCPDGVIFDPSKGACIHPDLSHRKDCAARYVLNFTCPNAGKKFVRLRFGDHDRLPHTTNCRKFFICLADGKPRVGGCPLGKVFNPKLGMCDSPKRVPECKDYYGKKDLKKLAKLAELGEEGSLDENEEQIESDVTDDETTNEEQQQPVEESPSKTKAKGKKFQQSKRQVDNSAATGAAPQPAPKNSPSSQVNGPQPQPKKGQSKSSDDDDDSDDGEDDD